MTNPRTMGICLVAAAALFWIAWVLMPGVGVTDAQRIFELVSQKRAWVASSVVVQLVSAALYVAALAGVLTHPELGARRDVRTGATLFLIGALGSTADAVLHLTAFAMTAPGVDQAQMIPVMRFLQTEGLWLLAPLLACFFVGGAKLSFALARARVITLGGAYLHWGALEVAVVGGALVALAWAPSRAVGIVVLGSVALAHAWAGIGLATRVRTFA